MPRRTGISIACTPRRAPPGRSCSTASQVTGGTPKQRTLFYSTLYHSFASPRLIARKGERFTDANGQVQVAGYDRYGPVPFWDTGRNQIALLMLLEPNVVQDIMRSELDRARERGYMNTSFHGDHAVFLYDGAWQRGIAVRLCRRVRVPAQERDRSERPARLSRRIS